MVYVQQYLMTEAVNYLWQSIFHHQSIKLNIDIIIEAAAAAA